MKELSLYKIKDIAMGSGRAVYTIQQLSNMISKPRAISIVYSSRLVKKGLARRLGKGRISFTEDDLVISTQLVEPSYISLNSSLLFHSIIQQVPKRIECVTTKNTLDYKDKGIFYHKIPGALFFGYKKYQKSGSYVFVAEPEKAIIDGLYLNAYSRKDIAEYMPYLDRKRLSELCAIFSGNWGSKKISEMIK
ncbi:MAG: type IV toxin-antitoxin system AbiEi family antitoxin domain-containing protein [Candidatus Micrarchaeaceae archaeon]